MAYWILQANPARYRLPDALANPASIRTWMIAHHRNVVAPGDRFALWVTGESGGVLAVGSVTAQAELVAGADPYWEDAVDGDRPAWRIGIRVDEVLASPIPRAELAADPAFADAAIIRMPGGGNPFAVTESQWLAIESRRTSRPAELSEEVEAPDAVDATDSALRRRESLRWTREELILALELFIEAGVVNGGRFLGRDDPRVIALSEELRGMPTHPGIPREQTFRNPSGVELKLMNFRAVDKAVRLAAGTPGAESLPAGMASFSAGDRALFEEYFNRDFAGLAEDAEAIRAAAAALDAPLATVTVQDRPVEDAGTATYESAGAEGGTRSRSEHVLVCRYADWLTASGVKAVSRLYRVPGLARPFLCDVFLPGSNALIEAKSNDRREAIRTAIGQLMDYQHLEGTDANLAVLLPHEPNPDVRRLLDALGIGSIWPSGEGFRDSVGGALTQSLRSS
jgi:EVE domain